MKETKIILFSLSCSLMFANGALFAYYPEIPRTKADHPIDHIKDNIDDAKDKVKDKKDKVKDKFDKAKDKIFDPFKI